MSNTKEKQRKAFGIQKSSCRRCHTYNFSRAVYPLGFALSQGTTLTNTQSLPPTAPTHNWECVITITYNSILPAFTKSLLPRPTDTNKRSATSTCPRPTRPPLPTLLLFPDTTLVLLISVSKDQRKPRWSWPTHLVVLGPSRTSSASPVSSLLPQLNLCRSLFAFLLPEMSLLPRGSPPLPSSLVLRSRAPREPHKPKGAASSQIRYRDPFPLFGSPTVAHILTDDEPCQHLLSCSMFPIPSPRGSFALIL